MNYIILDLEWDSAYCVRHKRFVNQIIQIGAVKLDKNLDLISTFERTVRSKLSKKLSRRFVELTGITVEKMQNGTPLETAISEYNEWAGEDTVTLTWSTSDLYTIGENSKYLLNDGQRLKVDYYMDLQSYVQNKMKAGGFEITSQISLSRAADMLGVSSSGLELHTAKDDSILSVELFRYAYDKNTIAPYIKDTKNPDFYRRLEFKAYFINNIHDKNINKSELVFKCDKCGGTTERKNSWRYRNGWFSSNFKCENCGRIFIGRVSFKKYFDRVAVRKRILDVKAVENKNADNVQRVSEKV